MNENELLNIKESLLNQKSLILNKSNEFKKELLEEKTNIPDESEALSNEQSNIVTIFLHERDRNSLFQIESALNKILSGSFGQCEECASPIGTKRLQINPLARCCVECQEEQELYS